MAWGDGFQSFCSQHYAEGWCRVEHRYNCEGEVRSYQIEILSEDENCLIGLIDGTWEITTKAVVVGNAPALRYLRYHNVCRFDLEGCPDLDILDCESYQKESIDLMALTNLRGLSCCYSHLCRLDLTHLPNLQELDVSGCHSLKKIKAGNNTILKTLTMINVELDSHSEKWLRRIVAANDGEIIDKYDWE